MGDARQFKNGRQLAAWVGLTPRHAASAERLTVLDTSQAGHTYLRYLLIHGARTVVRWATNKTDPLSRWIQALIARRGKHKAIVALANKCTRIAWALLTRKETYNRALATACA